MVARLTALAGVVIALVCVPQASGKSRDIYALRYGAQMNLLVPYDPVRLVPSGAAIRLGAFAHAWSMSPDRTRLVVAAGWRATQGEPAAVRVVDLVGGGIEGTLSLDGEFRRITATAWVRDRVLAVVSGSDSATVYAIDPDRLVVLDRAEVPGVVLVGDRSRNGVVLVLATPGHIGPATLAVIDRTLRVRKAMLERITAGTSVQGQGAQRRITLRRPGLTVGPAGEFAFVFGAQAPAAAVNLRTLAVRYSPQRLPAATTKRIAGSFRAAATLFDGRIVVSRVDYGSARSSVHVVDPKSWSSRTLVTGTSWFRVGSGIIFTYGSRAWNHTGLRMWNPSGRVLELFRGRSVSNVYTIGPRAFVTFFGTGQRAAVVEIETGRVVRRTVPARPLLGSGEPISG